MSALPVYRAWHKQRRMMYQVVAFNLQEQSVAMSYGDGFGWHVCSPDEMELMSYTGYTDKHDKKIFQGDLVHVNGYEGVFQVVWGMFRDCCVEGETWVLSPTIYQTTVWYHAQCKDDDDEWLEVVGNIYENK